VNSIFLKQLQNSHYDQPIQITKNIWWVGHYLPGDPFQCHTYLIDQGDQSVLLDPGSVLTFEHTLKKINVVTSFNNIRYFLCQHQDPDITGIMPTIDNMVTRDDACLVSHWRANVLLKHYGLKMPLLCIEKQFNWQLDLQDIVLQFIFTPYLHFPGAFCTYEGQSKILFSSDLFGGFTESWSLLAKDESYFESLLPFHEHYMPSREILLHTLLKLEQMDIGLIAPQHGSMIPEHLISTIIRKLKDLDCGLYLSAEMHTDVMRLSRLNQVLKDIKQAMAENRDFPDIIQALLKISKQLLPAKAMEFYTHGKNGQASHLAIENGYKGEAVMMPEQLSGIFTLDQKSWQKNHQTNYIYLQPVDEINAPTDDRLLIPLFTPEESRIFAVFFLCLERKEVVSNEAKEMIDQLSFVLQVAVERKQIEEELLKALDIAKKSAMENQKLNKSLNHALFDQKNANEGLNRANKFIRKTFGRYMSDDVVSSILDNPDGMQLGGESKVVSVMMTDLRGFTSIGERMPPEEVITMLNIYLETMTEIILKYNGTIIEFLGDGILALFGAPLTRDDDAQRAVACVLEMQLAMPTVNAKNQELGFPNVSMGGGLNTGQVVAGNIGSDLRAKYGVVGKTINLTARIESMTVGGQLLISESTLKACNGLLRIDDQWPVTLKGVPDPVTVYSVGGIDGSYQVHLPQPKQIDLKPISDGLTVLITILKGKHTGGDHHAGLITAISSQAVEITTALKVDRLSNLKIQVFDIDGKSITDQLYGKVVATDIENDCFQLHFTSIPPEAEKFFLMLSEQTVS
jgi:class 3 adenylate cyclase